MKRLLFLLCLFLLIQSSAFSQTAEENYKTASALYDQKNFASAVQAINRALRKDSTNASYLLLKGNACVELKRYQDAFNAYSWGIQTNPKDAILYNQRGVLLKTVLQTDAAIKDFSAALRLDNPDSIRLSLLVNRGAAKMDVRDFQGAYDDYSAALKLDTPNVGTLNNLATVCDEVGKGDQTLTYLYKIIQIDSTFIGAYSNVGFKYQELGEYALAIKFFNKVLQLDPKEALGYSNRAYSYYKLGQLTLALNDVNTSLKLYPGNSYAFRTRALIQLALNDKAAACGDLDEAIRLGFTTLYGDEVERLKKEHCGKGSLTQHL